MDEEWRLEGMVDGHLEKTILVLNLNISCGLPEIKCFILTWMELCCLTSELFFGNMIRFISLGICSGALPDTCVWPFPWHWKILKFVCVYIPRQTTPLLSSFPRCCIHTCCGLDLFPSWLCESSSQDKCNRASWECLGIQPEDGRQMNDNMCSCAV